MNEAMDSFCSKHALVSRPLMDLDNVISIDSASAQHLKSLLSCAKDVFLLGRQGKSKHLGVWSYSGLMDSCMNLHDVGEERLDGNYVIPEGGMRLKGRMIVLSDR